MSTSPIQGGHTARREMNKQPEPPRCYVAYPGNDPRPLKNLGWLLAHWRDVESFRFDYKPDDTWDGQLVANLRGGGEYVTSYASLTVCWRWLNRPVFRGLQLTVANMQALPDYATRAQEIGSAMYNAIMKLDCARDARAGYQAQLLAMVPEISPARPSVQP